jgi:short-subunit dehydrogenase
MSDSTNTLGTAVITGASAGIGRVFADRLAKRGYDLLLIARRGDLLDEVAKKLSNSYGVTVKTLAVDLSKPSELQATADKLSADSSITMLVNNAGVSTLAPIGGTKAADAASMISVNISALTALTIAVLPGFKARDKGTIVNIGSVLGFASLPISSIYSGTKGYVFLFTRGLQEEVAGTQVRVQLVAPAATATDIWELSGLPLSNLDAATVMTAENCVDAALRGMDLGEAVTMPSSNEPELLPRFDELRVKLLIAAQHGKPADRYAVA